MKKNYKHLPMSSTRMKNSLIGNVLTHAGRDAIERQQGDTRGLLQRVMDYMGGEPIVYKKQSPKHILYKGTIIKPEEIDNIVKPVLFGEISNRDSEHQKMEAKVILSTALNRLSAHKKRGTDKTLSDVFTEPNQYQAYQPDRKESQYSQYSNPQLDTAGVDKKSKIDSFVDTLSEDLRKGTFKDATGGAYYYKHKEDGSIEFDNKKPLFAN
jgi:hypothetical protein